MDPLGLLRLVGGIALFLYGIHTMSSSLSKIAGNKLESALEKMAGNKYKAFMLGLLVAALTQSSTATTIMVVGFVNAGIMKLKQAVGVIIGANLGTTVTAQLIRMGDIDSGNLLLQLLRPSGLTPIALALGFLLFISGKRTKRRDIGVVLIGVGILFTGIMTMELAISPLRDVQWFRELFVTFTNPILGFGVGAGVTAVLQSSTASVGILQALSTTGQITFAAAFPIILGQNVGTTLSTVLSSVGGSKNARRAAFIHLFYNVIGAAFFLVLVLLLPVERLLPFWNDTVDRGMIADAHAVYNIICALVALPFAAGFVRLANWAVRVGPDEMDDDVLSTERFTGATNLIAIEYARRATLKMAAMAKSNVADVTALANEYDPKIMKRVMEVEDSIDRMEVKLGYALMRLSNRVLSPRESLSLTELFNAVNDIERIGDHAINVAESAAQLAAEDVDFSPQAKHELSVLLNAVEEILDITLECFSSRTPESIVRVEPYEEVIDTLTESIKARHIERLKSGVCVVEAGTALLEMLISLERIADHCSNIAVAVSRTSHPISKDEEYDTHLQKHLLHLGKNSEYNKLYSEVSKRFMEELDNFDGDDSQLNIQLPD